mgnify:CR=1 FL=1
MTPAAFKREYGEDRVTTWPNNMILPGWFDWFRVDVVYVAEYYEVESKRRTLVARKFIQLGQMPNGQALTDLLADILPDTFIGLVHTSSADATTHVPLGATIPGGITVPADGLWSSSIAFIAIETEQPTGMSAADYRREIGAIHAWLHDTLPAWAEFGAFRDGDLGAGFFLDQTRNLDEQRFAT